MFSPEAHVRATEYTVSCLPASDVNAYLFTLTVEERSEGRWAVCRNSSCYDREGRREHERIPSERRAEWLARFRFPLEEALEIAKRLAPTITVNGYTVSDALTGSVEES